MPIANCLVRGELPAQAELDGLTALWSEESGIGPEHMTINVVSGMRQNGAAYPVMALLYLPSLWEPGQVRDLQTGLARALARGLGVALAEVQVITSIVDPGHVVEDGETQRW